jgi:carbamoyl-phosphate synthase small subunit
VLADGRVFRGRAFGAVGRGLVVEAEVVFNTAMSGYQESLTDPSYSGQILVQTFPLIGNTGVNGVDVESGRVQVAGLVVRELARRHSNFRAQTDLSTYLAGAGVLGMEGVDTRALTRTLRTGGAMNGAMTDNAAITDAELLERARNAPDMAGQNLVPGVGRTDRCGWDEAMGEWAWSGGAPASGGRPLRVVALDCGAKRNILRNLTERACQVTIVPHDTPASDLRKAYKNAEFDGLFVSNGPGDPAAVGATIATLRDLVLGEPPIPIFGICLGHQLLALAVGAKTYKLPFGHRGANQPVLDRLLDRVEITSQNHGFAVDRASLEAAGGEVTHTHLNDGTVAGFRLVDRPVFSVQYHPEASPGPHDAGALFGLFMEAMRSGRPPEVVTAGETEVEAR